MRITLSQYPADDIFAIICLSSPVWVCIAAAIVIAIRNRRTNRYKPRHVPWYDQLVNPVDNQDEIEKEIAKARLRRFKEREAADQEIIDRATEYHNGIA